jgi:hypothetical protein
VTRISRIALVVGTALAARSVAWASTESALAAAAAAGHPVFLVVTEGDAAGMDAARRVTSDAQKLAPGTSILEMDRSDKANAAVVKKYRLETVPVPLILVLAANGVAAGGARPGAVTPERLAAMIPTPARAALLRSIDEKKATLVVFARESTEGRDAARKAAEDAATALRGAATVVLVDLDDEKEAKFVAESKVDPKSKQPLVAVYNAKGQAIETFSGVPKVEALVAAVSKEPKECCPGGRCK